MSDECCARTRFECENDSEAEIKKLMLQLKKAEEVLSWYATERNPYEHGSDLDGDMVGRVYHGKRAREYFKNKESNE